ncbi:hypothetical protein BDW72DRAFT_162349 [Aspergillus terricola var. indicus]
MSFLHAYPHEYLMVAACYLVHFRHLLMIWYASLSLFTTPYLVDADAALIYTRIFSHSPLVYLAHGSLCFDFCFV